MPELPAQDTPRPSAAHTPSRQITTGQWVAIGGLAIGPLALPYRVVTDASFDLTSVIWIVPVSATILSLVAYGLARRSRVAFVIVAFMAFAQLTAPMQFSTGTIQLLNPVPPIASVIVFLGLWLSRDLFWRRGG